MPPTPPSPEPTLSSSPSDSARWVKLVDQLVEHEMLELDVATSHALVAHHFERAAELAQTDPDEAARTVLEALEEDEGVAEIFCDEDELAEAIRNAL